MFIGRKSVSKVSAVPQSCRLEVGCYDTSVSLLVALTTPSMFQVLLEQIGQLSCPSEEGEKVPPTTVQVVGMMVTREVLLLLCIRRFPGYRH